MLAPQPVYAQELDAQLDTKDKAVLKKQLVC